MKPELAAWRASRPAITGMPLSGIRRNHRLPRLRSKPTPTIGRNWTMAGSTAMARYSRGPKIDLKFFRSERGLAMDSVDIPAPNRFASSADGGVRPAGRHVPVRDKSGSSSCGGFRARRSKPICRLRE